MPILNNIFNKFILEMPKLKLRTGTGYFSVRTVQKCTTINYPPKNKPDIPPLQGEVSEDCLKLTVQVPSNYTYSSANLLPVMIWIHGGAFMMGSSNDKIYNMENLSNATNSIIVSMNYRLGMRIYL